MDRYFWQQFGVFGNSLALIDDFGREEWTYRRLAQAVQDGRSLFEKRENQIIFLQAGNDAGAVLCYLGALAAGHTVYLGKGGWAGDQELLETYRPDILLWNNGDAPPPHYELVESLFGYRRAQYRDRQDSVGAGIGLLLSTSGSMGSPKLVRLSRRHLAIAADQVAAALRLDGRQRAITTLPMHFIYGLTVINSHLGAGASLVLTGRSVQDRAFWRLLDETAVTNLAGIPWTFQTMKAIAFEAPRHPTLRNLFLSGGALEPVLRTWLAALAHEGLNVFSMYGQTEATGRMCVLPPEFFLAKPDSVGLPVEGGSVICKRDGSVVFRGPNVMLGYAASRAQLTGDDNCKGTLATGDYGRMDEDGCLYITGRSSRIAKLFGMRLQLDEIEALLSVDTPVAVLCENDILTIYAEKFRPAGLERGLAQLRARLGVPAHCIRVVVLPEFSRAESGKIRYGELARIPAGPQP